MRIDLRPQRLRLQAGQSAFIFARLVQQAANRVQHAVEGANQHADFILRVAFHAHIQISLVHLRNAPPQLRKAVHQRMREQRNQRKQEPARHGDNGKIRRERDMLPGRQRRARHGKHQRPPQRRALHGKVDKIALAGSVGGVGQKLRAVLVRQRKAIGRPVDGNISVEENAAVQRQIQNAQRLVPRQAVGRIHAHGGEELLILYVPENTAPRERVVEPRLSPNGIDAVQKQVLVQIAVGIHAHAVDLVRGIGNQRGKIGLIHVHQLAIQLVNRRKIVLVHALQTLVVYALHQNLVILFDLAVKIARRLFRHAAHGANVVIVNRLPRDGRRVKHDQKNRDEKHGQIGNDQLFAETHPLPRAHGFPSPAPFEPRAYWAGDTPKRVLNSDPK